MGPVIEDQKSQRAVGLAVKEQALADVIEHLGTYFRVTMEVDLAAGGKSSRSDFADIVQHRRPAHRRACRRLPHHLFGVFPDIFVAAARFLRKVHGGMQLGEEGTESTAFVQPLQACGGAARHQDLLYLLAQL